MNNFEKYLKANKQKLELEEPINPEIWLSIENKVLKQKNKRSRLYIKWISAAAAVLVLAIIAMNSLYFQKSNTEQLLAKYGIKNQQFTQRVSSKKAILAKAKIPANRKEDFDILLKQLQFLDAQYQDYLQYIEDNGFQPFIGEQIINYYKSKIDLLDKIQQEIEKINNYEKQYQSDSPIIQLNI